MSKSVLRLQDKVNELGSFISKRTLINTSVSQVSVAWHIEHALHVLIGVCSAIKASDPSDFKPNYNLTRIFLFLRGSFPRGQGRAPKVTRPTEEASEEKLKQLIKRMKVLVDELEALPAKANFKHPYFGIINKKQTIYFLELHTKHHLKIIRDMLKKG
ncbi:hypothetical protein GCM10009117_14010 [Gangjinia marincola]|uniref:DinB-like domain-containing protein n=1 Tax=Gangjinia marincola TaxID=578463 RepID=A0ABN1MGF3_9FLAO